MNSISTQTPKGMLYLLMVLSGFAGLGYEIVWTRMLSVALGHEIVAVLAVIAAFFSGLALGAYVLNNRVRRSRHPGRVYAVLEAIIGLWAVALIFLIPLFNETFAELMGPTPSAVRHWSMAFIGTFLILLPATLAMGGTLPAMERIVSAWHRQNAPRQRVVGGLYAANTFGAVLGTVLSTFALIPWLGLTAVLLVLAFVNLVCVIGIILWVARCSLPAEESAPETSESPTMMSRGRLRITLLLTGLLGIGYEVLVIRVMSQVLENTVYTFASLLSVYLLGTALGAFLYQRYQNQDFKAQDNFSTLLGRLLQWLAMSCLLGVALLWMVDDINRFLITALGEGTLAAVVGEMGIALLIFLLPTLLMGATFSHLAQGARNSLGLGAALGLNTLGAASAPLLFGVVLLPDLGSKSALLLVCVCYLLLLPASSLRQQRWLTALPVMALLILFLLPAQLRFVTVPPDGELLSYQDGVMASVSVVSDANDVRYLKVNNHYTMGSSASTFSDRRQAHIPLLLHPDPRNALFLGLGTGSTFITTAAHPGLEATAVELIPEVVSQMQHFTPPLQTLPAAERIHISSADARRFVRSGTDNYDVIVAEVFHPSRDGAGALYTVEHFEAIQNRLREQGLFCQWLPLFQLDTGTLKTIIRTFVSVFPHSEAYLAHFSLGQPLIGLVGRLEPRPYSPGWLASRVSDRELAQELVQLRLDSDFALFGGYLSSGPGLKAFAGAGPLNTDDHPVVTYQAPGFVYDGPSPASTRLLEVVNALAPDPDELFLDSELAAAQHYQQRFQDYWQARDAYLAAGVGVNPGNDTHAMLAQIGKPLLSVVRMSSDFAPAYQPLLHMAYELSKSDPDNARALLQQLEEANPRRTEAQRLRLNLFGS